MRLIDANALKRAINKDKAWKQYLDCGHAKSWIMQTIDEQQTIQSEQRWIPVKERNPIEYDNPIEFMATLEDPSGERYVEFIEWDGYEWDDFYTDDNERGVWGCDKVIAWMRKPEPFNGD